MLPHLYMYFYFSLECDHLALNAGELCPFWHNFRVALTLGGRLYPAQGVCWWRRRFRSGTLEQTQRCRRKGEGHGWVEWNTGRISRPSDLFGGLVPPVQGSATDSWRQTKWQRSSTQSAMMASWDLKEMPACVANKRRWAFLQSPCPRSLCLIFFCLIVILCDISLGFFSFSFPGNELTPPASWEQCCYAGDRHTFNLGVFEHTTVHCVGFQRGDVRSLALVLSRVNSRQAFQNNTAFKSAWFFFFSYSSQTILETRPEVITNKPWREHWDFLQARKASNNQKSTWTRPMTLSRINISQFECKLSIFYLDFKQLEAAMLKVLMVN